MATYPGSGNTTAPEGTDSEHHCLPAVGIEHLPLGVSSTQRDLDHTALQKNYKGLMSIAQYTRYIVFTV